MKVDFCTDIVLTVWGLCWYNFCACAGVTCVCFQMLCIRTKKQLQKCVIINMFKPCANSSSSLGFDLESISTLRLAVFPANFHYITSTHMKMQLCCLHDHSEDRNSFHHCPQKATIYLFFHDQRKWKHVDSWSANNFLSMRDSCGSVLFNSPEKSQITFKQLHLEIDLVLKLERRISCVPT